MTATTTEPANNIYQYEARIRYSEVDSESRLSATALVDLFQNCSTFQSEDLGVGVEYLKEQHRAWFLTSWNLQLNHMPICGDTVTVQTWSTGIKTCIGTRNFRLLSSDGECLACASTIWAYVDTNTLIPAKCPTAESDLYGAAAPLDMEPAPRKIALPETMEAHEPFEVKRYFIDTNHHMNNGKYILAALEYIPEDFTFTRIRTEFKKSAVLHDMIYPKTAVTADLATVALTAQDGSIYAVVQFIR